MSLKRYLFYISENYSFEILRPLQSEIISRGDEVKWFISGNGVNLTNLKANEVVIDNVKELINYAPQACFIPGNMIPRFIPGLKVHVFHGLEWKKKGHFTIRECFDLYCTHGAACTGRFVELANKHQFFDVVETGWPKLDTLFTTKATKHFDNDKPNILYAPTFSPSLTSAPELFDELQNLINKDNYNWIIKFHPKMASEWVKKYHTLHFENLKIVAVDGINELLQWADILLSDTSSVIGEFSLLGKPVVTLNNSHPANNLIDISKASDLESSILNALSRNDQLTEAILDYAQQLHPYKDGQSSARILDTVDDILNNGKKNNKPLPLNLFRNLKQRVKLKFWW